MDAIWNQYEDLDDSSLKYLLYWNRKMCSKYGIETYFGERGLLHEALLRAAEGRRKQKEGESFVFFICSIMSSIASHAVEAKDYQNSYYEDDEDPILASQPSNGSDRSELTEALFDCLDGDQEGKLVLSRKLEGMKGPEIQRDLGISENRFQTIDRRIKRKLKNNESSLKEVLDA